jgi:hypothetical protein
MNEIYCVCAKKKKEEQIKIQTKSDGPVLIMGLYALDRGMAIQWI